MTKHVQDLESCLKFSRFNLQVLELGFLFESEFDFEHLLHMVKQGLIHFLRVNNLVNAHVLSNFPAVCLVFCFELLNLPAVHLTYLLITINGNYFRSIRSAARFQRRRTRQIQSCTLQDGDAVARRNRKS